jgi:hypothetical protein
LNWFVTYRSAREYGNNRHTNWNTSFVIINHSLFLTLCLIFFEFDFILEHYNKYSHSNFNDLILKFIPLLGLFSKYHLITWGTQQERQQAAQQHDQLRHTTRNVTLSLDCSDLLIECRKDDNMRGLDGCEVTNWKQQISIL